MFLTSLAAAAPSPSDLREAPAEGVGADRSTRSVVLPALSAEALQHMVAYWIQWLYLEQRVVLMRRACQVPLADPTEIISRRLRLAISAVLAD